MGHPCKCEVTGIPLEMGGDRESKTVVATAPAHASETARKGSIHPFFS